MTGAGEMVEPGLGSNIEPFESNPAYPLAAFLLAVYSMLEAVTEPVVVKFPEPSAIPANVGLEVVFTAWFKYELEVFQFVSSVVVGIT